MRIVLTTTAILLLLASMWIGLSLGLVDGLVRNIIYVHVPSSICALLCFTVVLVAGIGYLMTQKMAWDHVALAAAEVGLIFATVLNATGMIFSRAEWNIWWTPSPRLVTSAILWFLYVVYLILRSSVPSQRQCSKVCAVFGTIAFLDVPLVYISARFLPDIHKPNFSFDSGPQRLAFVMGIIGTFILAGVMIWLRRDILSQKHKLEQQLFE